MPPGALTHRDVLIVDDDTAVRSLLETLMTRRGLTVVTARDGAEALLVLDWCVPDAILLDLIMPRVSGYEFLEKIRAERPELLSHVIVFTAAQEGSRDTLTQGSWATIRKPASTEAILQTLFDCMLQPELALPRKPSRSVATAERSETRAAV